MNATEVLVNSTGTPEARTRCSRSGAVSPVTRPVSAATLLRMLGDFMPGLATRPA